MSKKPTVAPQRHFFNFQVDGAADVSRFPARVRYPRKTVDLYLTAEHVLAAIEAKGWGNPMKCAGAFCARAHKFPHAVDGYVDWLDSRAYVVSKVKNRLPYECFGYTHRHPEISKLFDTKVGAYRLLEMIEQNGPIHIRLTPARVRIGETNKGGTGKRDLTRTKIVTLYGSETDVKPKRGAEARFARVGLGRG